MAVRLPQDAKCLNCGYLLRGLDAARCPECGKPFSPGDPATYRSGDQTRLSPFYLSGPPGQFEVGIALTLASFAFAELSAPGEMIPYVSCLAMFVGFLALLYVGYAYLLRLCTLLLFRFGRMTHEPEQTGRRHRRWLVTPICVLIVVSVIAYPWPCWIRFKISQPALEQAVKDLNAGKAPASPGFIGLFHVEEIKPLGPGYVFFRTGQQGFGDEGGLVHRSTTGPAHGALVLGDGLAPGWFTARLSW